MAPAAIPPEAIPEMRRSILRRTVKDLIADNLASLVATGVLRIGDELPGERELSSLLSVSRETIRGAIQSLAARGIVDVSHGSRTRVARADVGPVRNGIAITGTIDNYDLDAVHAARLLVEREVVADAAERVSRETLGHLEGSLSAQRAMLRDPVRSSSATASFTSRSTGRPGTGCSATSRSTSILT